MIEQLEEVQIQKFCKKGPGKWLRQVLGMKGGHKSILLRPSFDGVGDTSSEEESD